MAIVSRKIFVKSVATDEVVQVIDVKPDANIDLVEAGLERAMDLENYYYDTEVIKTDE